jgi:hypothetical protein
VWKATVACPTTFSQLLALSSTIVTCLDMYSARNLKYLSQGMPSSPPRPLVCWAPGRLGLTTGGAGTSDHCKPGTKYSPAAALPAPMT